MTAAETPIACTLTPDGFTARMGLIEALAADGMIDRTSIESGVRVRLRATPELERRARDLVAAESECCAFLDFELTFAKDTIVLEITGPEDAQPVIDLFFETAVRRACARG